MTTETDRELLKLAARARGGIKYFNDAFRSPETGYREWNPLTDDGDALRLAVKLKIEIAPECYQDGEVTVFCGHINAIDEIISEHGCAFTATRRAITRAAAEIGRVMV